MGAIGARPNYACTLTVGRRSGGRIDDCLGEGVLSLKYTGELGTDLERMGIVLIIYWTVDRWWLCMDCEFVNYALGLGWALVATALIVQAGEDSYGWVHPGGGGAVARSGVRAHSRCATARRGDVWLGGSINCIGRDWRCDTMVRLCRSWVGVYAFDLGLWEGWGCADTVRHARYPAEIRFECSCVAGCGIPATDAAGDVRTEAGRVVPIYASGRVTSQAVRGTRGDALRLRGGELIGECRSSRVGIQDVRYESQDVRRDVCASWKAGPDRRISERCSWRSRLGERMAPSVASVEGPCLGGLRDRARVTGGSRAPHGDGLDISSVLDRAQTMRSPPLYGGGVSPEAKAKGEDVWGRGTMGGGLDCDVCDDESGLISPVHTFSTPGPSSNSAKSEIESGTNATMGMRGSGRSRSVVPPYTGVRRTPDETEDAEDEESGPDGGEADAPGGVLPSVLSPCVVAPRPWTRRRVRKWRRADRRGWRSRMECVRLEAARGGEQGRDSYSFLCVGVCRLGGGGRAGGCGGWC